MMRSKVKLSMAWLLSSLLIVSAADAAVSVIINDASYQFETNPRLSEVLAPVALQSAWYWPAATLYQLDSNKPEQLRQQLLRQIAELKLSYAADSELVDTLGSLELQLASWRLAQRILLSIDYDFARVRPEFNPRFDDGAYLLRLTQRPDKVHLFGAISTAVTLQYRDASAAAFYLASAQPTASANLAELVLLQPDGKVQTAGAAYWNKTRTEAMPGAQIFIPLKSRLFNSQLEILNQRLLELAIHRVLP